MISQASATNTPNTSLTFPVNAATVQAFVDEVHFTADGLVPAIAHDPDSGEILMMAWMNEQSLVETLNTGWVTYWSRSRASLWRKGETSGHRQTLTGIQIDCDGDTLLLSVKQTGAACHTGARSCFFRFLSPDGLISAS